MSDCTWPGNSQMMRGYHDTEWCRPSHDDQYIFEILMLEGAQAGLSWSIVLNKREEYKKAFHDFDIEFCAGLSDDTIEQIKVQYNVVKHLAKLYAVRSNAQAALKLQAEFGSLANYFWHFVEDKPIINHWEAQTQIPAKTELSEKISKDLRKRGFKFVGAVILYSFLQAVGIVDDHISTCAHHTENRSK